MAGFALVRYGRAGGRVVAGVGGVASGLRFGPAGHALHRVPPQASPSEAAERGEPRAAALRPGLLPRSRVVASVSVAPVGSPAGAFPLHQPPSFVHRFGRSRLKNRQSKKKSPSPAPTLSLYPSKIRDSRTEIAQDKFKAAETK